MLTSNNMHTPNAYIQTHNLLTLTHTNTRPEAKDHKTEIGD